MRPLKLKLRSFGPFAGEESVDFTTNIICVPSRPNLRRSAKWNSFSVSAPGLF